MKKPQISLILSVYNEERDIEKCISSILSQKFRDFEVIIIDDASTDNTSEIIHRFRDKRIRYYRNSRNIGFYRNRNKAINLSKGDWIYFTDGDCILDNSCLYEGIKLIRKKSVLGVEGLIYYVSKNYYPTYSDKAIDNLTGNKFTTGNILYKKDILKRIGGFDIHVAYNGDRKLGLEVKKFGDMIFSKKMIVFHQKDIFTIPEFMKSARRAKTRVILFKKFGEKDFIHFRILFPLNLLAILFPPIILLSFFRNSYKTWADFRLFLFLYPRMIYERYIIWKTAIEQKVFVI